MTISPDDGVKFGDAVFKVKKKITNQDTCYMKMKIKFQIVVENLEALACNLVICEKGVS